ncbi:MAG: TIGR00730 family Rossman fold protein [Elusimicrobia bacterium]|nr:TIGR00730 family Rossman fold protein [Elusimicrobiota bacterium]
MTRVCVFCGSNPGRDPRYYEAAVELGRAIAGRGWGLVFGGGRVGLMGAIADAALEAGGEAIGVIPDALMKRELGHRGLTRLEVVGSMHERKARMEALSDAFIAMPGGFGTLDEFCEILTWSQLAIHAKPCGILNTGGYFDPFLAWIDRAVEAGFVKREDSGRLSREAAPEALLDALVSRGLSASRPRPPRPGPEGPIRA